MEDKNAEKTVVINQTIQETAKLSNGNGYYLGVQINAEADGIVLDGQDKDTVIGPSSKENLGKACEEVPEVEEKASSITAGNSCVVLAGKTMSPMPGAVRIQPGTVLHADGPVFTIQAGATSTIDVTAAEIASKSGVILELAEVEANAEEKAFPGYDKCMIHGPGCAGASFRDMKMEGAIYNKVASCPMDLDIELFHTEFTGVVSAPKADYATGTIMQLHNESVWTVTGNSYLSMFVMFEGCSVKAVEGKRVALIVNGVRKAMKPGIYKGDVRVEVVNAVESLGSQEIPDPFGGGMVMADFPHHYESALVVDGKVIPEESILDMIRDAEITDEGITGGVIENESPAANGILIKNGDYRIQGVTIHSRAHGGDDFEGYGAMITAAGRSKVVVSDSVIDNEGAVCTASCAMEYADLLVKDSMIRTIGLESDTCWADSMTEVPWVLGLKGTVRSTNIVNCATATYYKCDMTSNGWGVISSDDTAVGSVQNVVNTKAVIKCDGKFDSGYVLYSLNGIETHILGSVMETPDYPVTFGGAKKDCYIGPSSKANLEKYIGVDSLLAKETNGFADVEEQPTVLYGGSNALMWHHVCEAKTIIEDAILRGDKIALLVKAKPGGFMGMPGPTSHPEIELTRCTVESANRVIYHLIENDDPGMGNDCHDLHWASFYEVPDTSFCDASDWDAADPEAKDTAILRLNDMSLDGNIFNSRFLSCQNLSVVLSNTEIKGVISGGRQYHKQANVGELITPAHPEKLGDVGCIPAPVAGNGVIVKLENGSVWTVDSGAYISALEIEEGSTVAAPNGCKLVVEINGEPVELKPGKYTGNIYLNSKKEMPF